MADQISFARGAPSADIIPAEELRAAANQVLQDDPAGALAYGPGHGYAPLRDWVADRHGVDPARVTLTNGSLEGGMMLFDLLVEPGDTVVVEAPSYDRTLLGLKERGAELLAVPLEDDGLDTGALEAALEGGARPKFVHTIPNFHNPAGCTLSHPKRDRLLELAAEYDFLIFEDDPYREVRFEGEDLPTMLSADTGDRVVYACSFSKTIAPGVRTGYLIGPTDIIDQLKRNTVNTRISPNTLAEAIVGEFCRSGQLDRAIENVRVALRARRDAVAQALREHFGDDARFVTPEGGYFLWVEFPEGTDTGTLLDACKQKGVTFVKGSDFMLEGGDNCMRLAYSAVTPEQASEGIALIAETLGAGAGAPA